MSVFAVIAPGASDLLTAAVERAYPGRFYLIAPGQYLVAADNATTIEVNEKLGGQDGTAGKMLLLPVTNYGGWHQRDMWEWIAAQTRGANIATFNVVAPPPSPPGSSGSV